MNTVPVKVEKGIPIPASRESAGLSGVLRSMEIGDSFVVSKSVATQTRNLVSLIARTTNRKFTCRINSAAGVLRVWRLA